MKTRVTLPFTVLALVLSLLSALPANPALAAKANPGQCPAIHRPQPSVEDRQHIDPMTLLRCFLSTEEIDTVKSAIDHDAQTTVTDPAFDSGELNPDGSTRPALTSVQIAALARMHAVLDQDMRAGAILRKFVVNSDVGGILYGRTVLSSGTIVTTTTVRGFVGLERNTQGLGAGETIGALGLDYETTPTGQFTDASGIPFRREVSLEVLGNGLHSIRHIMSAQAAKDAKIPLAKDLNDTLAGSTPSLVGRSFEMNRQGQANPYTGLGISNDIGLLTLKVHDDDETYRLHLNEEDVMTVPTPLALGDVLLRRRPDGAETVVARYVAVANADGTVSNRWVLSRTLSRPLAAYYGGLLQQAAMRVAAAGG
jgi:hypothetical protein